MYYDAETGIHLDGYDVLCKWINTDGCTVAFILPGWNCSKYGAKIYFLQSQDVLDTIFPLMQLEGIQWEIRVFDKDGHLIYKDHSKSHFAWLTLEYCERSKAIEEKADALFAELEKKIKHDQDLARRRARRAAKKKEQENKEK